MKKTNSEIVNALIVKFDKAQEESDAETMMNIYNLLEELKVYCHE